MRKVTHPDPPELSGTGEPDAPPPDAHRPGAASATDQDASATPNPNRTPAVLPTSRLRDSWLWTLPILVLAAMAVGSRFWGTFGVLIAGVVASGVIVLFLGGIVIPPRGRLFVLVGICALLTVTFVAATTHAIDVEPATRTTPSGKSIARGADTSKLDQLRRGTARGATLGPLVLDHKDLAEAHLNAVRLQGASLVQTVLNRATLAGTDFTGASMGGVQLRGANLRGADLRGVDLRDGDLTDACLLGADLHGAILDRANFTGAAVDGAQSDPVSVGRATGWNTMSPAGAAACLIGP